MESKFVSQQPDKWQVFFLPKRDPKDTEVVGYCPFTSVYAEGSSVPEAAENWKKKAEQKYNRKFQLPPLTKRKVWYGQEEDKDPVYVLDFPFQPEATAFCPVTKESLKGTPSEWQSKEPGSDIVPSTWVDWTVPCTPLNTAASSEPKRTQSVPIQNPAEPSNSYLLRDDFTLISPQRNSFKIDSWLKSDSQPTFIRSVSKVQELEVGNSVHCDVITPVFFHASDEKKLKRVFEVFTVINTFDCRVDKDGIQWSEDSKRILNTANAGGNSQYSEALSNELISTLTRGRLLKTEMEIEYFPMGGKITDFCMEIDGQPIGVSVTRALKFRGQFTEKDATSLLTKKLDGINQSTRCVCGPDTWNKQILHIWSDKEYITDVLEKTYKTLDSELKSNTLIICTTTHNADWIYRNR